MEIEWDLVKAKGNVTKHGIAFSEVEPAFYDQFALSMPDTSSEGEERFVLIGTDALNRIIVVSYTYRGEAVRIISARPATKRERREYEKGIRF